MGHYFLDTQYHISSILELFLKHKFWYFQDGAKTTPPSLYPVSCSKPDIKNGVTNVIAKIAYFHCKTGIIYIFNSWS